MNASCLLLHSISCRQLLYSVCLLSVAVVLCLPPVGSCRTLSVSFRQLLYSVCLLSAAVVLCMSPVGRCCPLSASRGQLVSSVSLILDSLRAEVDMQNFSLGPQSQFCNFKEALPQSQFCKCNFAITIFYNLQLQVCSLRVILPKFFQIYFFLSVGHTYLVDLNPIQLFCHMLFLISIYLDILFSISLMSLMSATMWTSVPRINA